MLLMTRKESKLGTGVKGDVLVEGERKVARTPEHALKMDSCRSDCDETNVIQSGGSQMSE